jgi:hypothetical protein
MEKKKKKKNTTTGAGETIVFGFDYLVFSFK